MLSMITSTQLTKLGPKAYLEARPSMLFKHVVESILPEEKRSESSNSFFGIRGGCIFVSNMFALPGVSKSWLVYIH